MINQKEDILNKFFENGDGRVISDNAPGLKNLKIDGIIEFANNEIAAYNSNDNIFSIIRKIYMDNEGKIHVGEQIVPGIYFIPKLPGLLCPLLRMHLPDSAFKARRCKRPGACRLLQRA